MCAQHALQGTPSFLTSSVVTQGQAVGTAAHLVALRREAIGKYHVKDAWTIEHLQTAVSELKRQKQLSKATDVDTQHGEAVDAASKLSGDGAAGSVQHDFATGPDGASER